MKAIKSYPSIGLIVLAAWVVLGVSKAEENKPALPGYATSIGDAVGPLADRIIVGELESLEEGMTRNQGYKRYYANFKVLKTLKGESEKALKLQLYVNAYNPENVQEKVRYIVFIWTNPAGNGVVAKMLVNNENTEKEVLASIAAAVKNN